MSGTKQWHFNLFIVMLKCLRCLLSTNNVKLKPLVLSNTWTELYAALSMGYLVGLKKQGKKNCVIVSLVNMYCQSAWCRVEMFSLLFRRNPSNCLWVGKVRMELSIVFAWVNLHAEALITSTTWKRYCLNFPWRCHFSINNLQYTENPDRELKLGSVELLRQWMWYFFSENRVVDSMISCINDNWKLCKNRNTHTQEEQNLFCKKKLLKSINVCHYFKQRT